MKARLKAGLKEGGWEEKLTKKITLKKIAKKGLNLIIDSMYTCYIKIYKLKYKWF